MNKNGEKEGKRCKGQKKDNRSTKVNKPKGDDSKVSADEADDVSNKFPNFSLLNAEERLVFYQALTAARKNVEKRGVPARQRFGTIHDEYLKFFNHEREEGGPDAAPASVTGAPGGSVSPSCGCSAEQPREGESPEGTKSQSPTLLLEGSSEAPLQTADLVAIETGLLDHLSDQCEAVIQQDTDKVMDMYLNKKKRNEAKSEELRPGGKKPDQGGERKAPKTPKKETAGREKQQQQQQKSKKKDSTVAYEISEAAKKKKETPRFDALDAEERETFFSILQEARNNIVGKNPDRKGQVLPLHAIVKRYTGGRPATSVYTSRVQELRRRCEGKKNLKVKVTLTSGDNERLQKTKSEDLSDTEKKSRRPAPSERPQPEDADIDRICENEADAEDLVEKDVTNKPNQSVSEKLQQSSLTIDIKSSPGLKNVRSIEEKMPPMEAKPSEGNEKEDGNVKNTPKEQSYYMKVPKTSEEPQRYSCPRGRNKPQTSSGDEETEQRKKLQEEMVKDMQEPLYEGSFEERLKREEAEEQEEEEEEEDEEDEEEQEEKEREEEEEWDSPSKARPECHVESCGTFRLPRGEEMREGSPTGICTMQVSSALVRDSQDVPEDVQKKEEEEAEVRCFPGDQGAMTSREKHSLMTVKSLFLGTGGEGRGGEGGGGEAEEEEEEEEEQEERAEGRKSRTEEEETKEFSGKPTSAKVMIVDDNVIEKIRKLIYYLEAKAGKDDRLEKEYMKLLVDYVDYLSKVLEVLVHKKKRHKQVQRAYPAEVSLKFEEGSEGQKGKKEGSKFIPRSVSAQEFGNEDLLVARRNASEEKSKAKSESEGVSTSLFLSDSDSSLHSVQDATDMPPATSNKKPVATKIRLLQDLLKKRAEFVESSTGELKFVHHPQEEYVPSERPPRVQLITEDDEEKANKGNSFKVIRFLIKCFTCGKKKQEEEGIFDNLKGEAVRVDVYDGQSKDPANATLNHSTMEVLKATGRKRLIDKYYGKN